MLVVFSTAGFSIPPSSARAGRNGRSRGALVRPALRVAQECRGLRRRGRRDAHTDDDGDLLHEPSLHSGACLVGRSPSALLPGSIRRLHLACRSTTNPPSTPVHFVL